MTACGLGEELGEGGKKGNLHFSEWCFNFDFTRMFYTIKNQNINYENNRAKDLKTF